MTCVAAEVECRPVASDAVPRALSQTANTSNNKAIGDDRPSLARTSVLARIEKFSNLPVIKFFFTVIKTKDQLFLRGIWADKMRKKAHKLAVHVFRY